jgi:hypothetical protein
MHDEMRNEDETPTMGYDYADERHESDMPYMGAAAPRPAPKKFNAVSAPKKPTSAGGGAGFLQSKITIPGLNYQVPAILLLAGLGFAFWKRHAIMRMFK